MNYRKILFTFLSIACIFLFQNPLMAQGKQNNNGSLKIGVSGSAPFVVDTEQQTGISLEIWQAMANREGLSYKLTYYQDVPHALAALDSGKLDAVVGPVSINSERAEKVKFTQPYYQSSISIMSRSEAPNIWQRIKPYFSIHFLYAVLVFLFILAIVGTLLWLAERKENPDEFPSKPSTGIANGMWCAIVTMSTTGYGDRSPRTLWGRICAGCWMVASIVFATTMVAGIASTLTLSGFNSNTISKAEQLSNKNVAVVKNSPADQFVKKYNAKEVYVDNLKEGYDALKAKKVDAVVYDRPQLLYFLKTNHDDKVAVSRNEYMRQGYGFAVPLDSKRLHEIDINLLKLQESGRVSRIVNDWLGEDNH